MVTLFPNNCKIISTVNITLYCSLFPLGNSQRKMERTVCFSIDVEPDFGNLLPKDQYYGKHHLSTLKRIAEQYDLKITAFVTGKTLEDNPDIIDSLRSMRAEIEQHSYSHITNGNSKIKDIAQGIEAHKRLLGTLPLGYRAPKGIITKQELIYLEKSGIKFDSSIFPTVFPGRYNRVGFPTEPFNVEGSNIVEMPFATIPKVRIPISLSYMQLLGLKMFRSLFKLFGLPRLMVYDFHTFELGITRSYNELKLIPRLEYFRAQRNYKDPATVFEEFVKYILDKGYRSKYMIDVYRQLIPNLHVRRWNGD
jgi:peptidoglycan/xylan/chitin deacetylase (PgdA/CDA1 family)